MSQLKMPIEKAETHDPGHKKCAIRLSLSFSSKKHGKKQTKVILAEAFFWSITSSYTVNTGQLRSFTVKGV